MTDIQVSARARPVALIMSKESERIHIATGVPAGSA
jgi:hypothetical protein